MPSKVNESGPSREKSPTVLARVYPLPALVSAPLIAKEGIESLAEEIARTRKSLIQRKL